MASENVQYHSHEWVISTDLYNKKPKIREFFDVVGTDTYVDGDGIITTFVTAVEGRKYPVFALMYHPEM